MTKKPFLNTKRLSYALIAGVILWTGWLASIMLGKGNRDAAGKIIFPDYIGLYTCGTLITIDQGAGLYDLNAQYEVWKAAVGGELKGYNPYINPPFFAWLFVPFTWVPYIPSAVIWTVLGLIWLWLSLKLLDLAKPFRAYVWALTFVPVFSVISFGQNTFMSMALLSLTYFLWRRKRLWEAGIVCSLLLYKPQLVLGLGLFWLFDWKRSWRALTGLTIGGVILVCVSFGLSLQASLDYVKLSGKLMSSFITMEGFPLWNLHSMRGFWLMLLPGQPVITDILFASCAGIGVWGFWKFWRHWRGHPSLLFAGAVCLTFWVTPYMMIYDWALLLIPALLLWIYTPECRDRWKVNYAIVWGATFVSGPLAFAQLKVLPFAVQISVPALILAFVGIYRILMSLPPESTTSSLGSVSSPAAINSVGST